MATARTDAAPFLHPLHAILLAFPIALFPAALASDVTYLNTAEMQWSNFSAWLIAGALLFAAPVVLWAIVSLVRHRRTAARTRSLVYLLLLVVMWIAGLINAFQHSHDAWASVGMVGLLLSILCAILALVAGWIAHSHTANGEVAR
jgi:uncharacterized membrane protein